MILVSKEDFISYLKKEGYKEWSQKGNETTIKSYVYSIERVMKIEQVDTWSEFTDHIQDCLFKYGEYGEMRDFGKESNSTVINALKRFMEFLLNEKGFEPQKRMFFI